MKILMASTPAAGHINPMLAIGRVLMAGGHELVCLSGTWLRDRIERAGAQFRALTQAADLDPQDILSAAPELKVIPPGPEWMRVAIERIFIDRISPQHQSLRAALEDFPADAIVADNTFFGVFPMLLGPRSERLPVVVAGTSFLHWLRDDGAPHFLGLPPATTAADRERYAGAAAEIDRIVHQPVGRRLNRMLRDFGVGPITLPLFDSIVVLADAYLQLSVPGFEFPRPIPRSVHFVGAPPIIAGQAPLPSWAGDLDGARKIVLVTQGTVANHNFGLLVAPTLAALADEPDVLVVVSTGGRPIDAIPVSIPGNARVATYLPFEWLLPKVDAFVTNGGYGSVNQALSFGIPLVTAGLTEDKADVNARVAWSGVGINLRTNEAAPEAVREAVRAVLDTTNYRARAGEMAAAFRGIDTRAEILRIVEQVVNGGSDAAQYEVVDSRTARAEPGTNRFARQPVMPPV